ncbi:hypothetical protein UAJ10_10425 [Nitrospirillum sp. BR 11164]|uniref:hypothetical protein n=1 Tax=Nitrospirillum sp. BR 11164 TaxID=3104324 RepID=UPI002AFF9AD5|nr:hypothetical protein [Nitrospirillum sp. BR 11164]MEA1649433.1 hypothetical protein [Nitrospirillum sp. BR 11164]
MFSDLDLVELVKAEMADFMVGHGLELAVIGRGEVLLRRADCAIKLIADRETIHVVYFDKRSEPVKGYNILLHLAHKRRDPVPYSAEWESPSQGYADHMKRVLRALTRLLDVEAKDILDGSMEWTRAYHWPTVIPDAETAALL